MTVPLGFARSHRRGQRSLAYGVRVRAEGYAYRKVGSCTTARPASEAHYHDRAFHPLVLRQRSNAVRQSPQVKVHTHVTPGQREVFMRYGHACALMSSGCGYPVLLMRLHGRRALIAALGAHAFAHTPPRREAAIPARTQGVSAMQRSGQSGKHTGVVGNSPARI